MTNPQSFHSTLAGKKAGPFAPALRQIIPQRLGVKLALVICVLVTTLISILGFTLTQSTQDMLKTRVRNSQEELAVRAANEISLFISRPVELLQVAANLTARALQDPWDQETVLVELSLEFPMFTEIVSVDSKGRPIASSNPGGDSNKNWLETPAFGQAMAGNVYVSPIRIEDDYLPHVTMAFPEKQAGKIAHVLIANVNLRGMWDIVDRIRIGEAGHAFLISPDGLVIAHPDKKLILKNINFNAYSGFQQILAGAVKSTEYLASDHRTYLASYAPVGGAVPVGIVVQLPTKEAYALLDQMHILIWSILLVSLFASVGVSFLVARRFVRPIRSLQHWSRKVALGDFEYRMQPESLDELGKLFLRFKRMSNRLKAARERERLATLGEASSMIAHKLKNSIVSLKTFAQLFPQRKHDQQFVKRFESTFSSSVDYLEKTFKSLSQMAADHDFRMEPVDVAQLLQIVRLLYSETASEQGIRVKLNLQTGLPLIQGDRIQLQELFVNLVQNAIQAMPNGGLLRLNAVYEVPAFVSEKPPRVVISISDTGFGIAPEHLEEIFNPFFTTKHAGMGLGLAIAKRIVDEHSGTISVSSIRDQETVFIITLPVLNSDISQLNPRFSAHAEREFIGPLPIR